MHARRNKAFTLVELLVVIVILALLMALLLPALGAAIRSARNAAVSAEINNLAQALADFKNKYGDYPPSRVILCENGYWDTSSNLASTTYLSGPNQADISVAALAQRSLSYMRKLFPRIQTSTQQPVWTSNSPTWYDFNGNGVMDNPYVLQGHECLVFFLGGIPTRDGSGVVVGLSGFAQNPQNPFMDDNVPNIPAAMVQPNRLAPFYEFDSARLAVDPNGKSGIPGYYDSLKTNRFYVYFSANGGQAYDPNDCNFDNQSNPAYETDASLVGPLTLNIRVNFPVQGSTPTKPNVATSAPPNPYTVTLTNPTAGGMIWQKPQTFQILSAGTDGQYGVGGFSTSTSTPALPNDLPNTQAGGQPTSDTEIRIREKDNLTNFNIGTLD